jgi:protein-tyrosine-phosphatase
MKVLFVCQNNVGRSQTAEVFFNQISQHNSTSAGTEVGEAEGQTIADVAQTTPIIEQLVNLTLAEGFPISSNQRNQLTSGMVMQPTK